MNIHVGRHLFTHLIKKTTTWSFRILDTQVKAKTSQASNNNESQFAVAFRYLEIIENCGCWSAFLPHSDVLFSWVEKIEPPDQAAVFSVGSPATMFSIEEVAISTINLPIMLNQLE